MRKTIVFYFLLVTSVSLFSQDNRYGLTQEDVNKLLGQYVISNEFATDSWREHSFSWGKQNVIDTFGDMIIIDYDHNITSSLGTELENSLLFFDSGLIFIITDIENISTNKFILSLVSMQYFEDFGIKNEGQITFEYLDNRLVEISNISRRIGFNFEAQWWKSAGPDVMNITQNSEESVIEESIVIVEDTAITANTYYEIMPDGANNTVVSDPARTWLWFLLLLILLVTVVVFFIARIGFGIGNSMNVRIKIGRL